MLESHPTGSHLHRTHWWHHRNLGPPRPHSHSLHHHYCQLLSTHIHGVLEAAMFVIFSNCEALMSLWFRTFVSKLWYFESTVSTAKVLCEAHLDMSIYIFLLFHFCLHSQLSQMTSNRYWSKMITWSCSTSISSCWRHTRHSAYHGDSEKSSSC